MNEQELKTRFPRASRSFIDANSELCSETDQPTSRKALGGKVAGKAKSDARISVRYVLYRVRLLDPDALDGATKVCTDILCQIGILTGDSADDITLDVTQEKVKHRNEQRTVLTIEYP